MSDGSGPNRRSFFQHLAGGASGRLVAFVSLPIVTRLAPPADIGLYSVVLAVSVMGSVAGLGRFEQVALIAERDEELGDLQVVYLLWISTGAATLFLALSLLTSWSTSTVVLSAGVYAVTVLFQAWMQESLKKSRHAGLATAIALEGGLTPLAQIAALLVLESALIALLLGRLISLILANATIAPWISLRSGLLRRGRFNRGLQLMLRYNRMVRLDLPSAVANTASWQTPVIFVNWWLGSAAGGYFAMAYKLLRLPSGFIGTPAGRVFTADFVNAEEEREKAKVSVFTGWMVLLSLLIYLPVIMLPVDWLGTAFGTILGRDWQPTGQYVGPLGLWVGAAFAVTHLGVVLLKTKALRKLLVFNISLLTGRIGIYLAATVGLIVTKEGFLWSLGITGLASYAWLYFTTMQRLSERSDINDV